MAATAAVDAVLQDEIIQSQLAGIAHWHHDRSRPQDPIPLFDRISDMLYIYSEYLAEKAGHRANGRK